MVLSILKKEIILQTLSCVTFALLAITCLTYKTNYAKANSPMLEPTQNDKMQADLNGDGIVNYQDFKILAEQWIQTKDNKKIISVYDCGCFSDPNSIFVLQNDIEAEGTCFQAKTGNFDLDLNNHYVTGNGTGWTAGVDINGYDNIVIKNGYISGFKFGIRIQNSNNSEVRDTLTNLHDGAGISISNSQNIELNNTTSNSNGDGISVLYSVGISFQNTETNYNVNGIDCYNMYNSDLNSIRSVSNLRRGIRFDSNSNNNAISSSTVTTNGQPVSYGGIEISSSSGIEIEDSNISGNNNYDIFVLSGSNVSILDTIIENEYVDSIPGSSLTRKWSYTVYVQDSFNPINNAKVYAEDVRGDLEFLVKTGADGKTSKIWVTDYINEEGTITNYAPFTITAEKEGYLTDSHVYEPNGLNQKDIFALEK